jgi:LysM repeat protein/transcriptional regulator with XRE-family HTH domain
MKNKNKKILIVFSMLFAIFGFVSIQNSGFDNYGINFEEEVNSFSTLNDVNKRPDHYLSLYNLIESKSSDKGVVLKVSEKEINFEAMEKLKEINPVALNYIEGKKGFPKKEDLNYLSRIYNVPENILYSIMMKESRGNPYAVSHKRARGAFQFMDQTAIEFNLFRNGKDMRNNPWYSADAAARYIKWLFLYVTPEKDYKKIENYTYTLAAYNAGIARVKRSTGVYIPNIKETQDYVSKIMGHIRGEKYIVQKGDSLSKIAENTGTTVAEIRKLNNNIRDKDLRYGNFISVKSIYHDADLYIVKKSDTLSKIANLTGVDLYTIKERNKLKGDIIYVGQQIRIP